MRRRHAFLALLAFVSAAETVPFRVSRSAEVVARLELSSPNADWAAAGREAALATLQVDGGRTQHVMLWGGPQRLTYSVFLGRLPAGAHRLTIGRHPQYSAREAGLAFHGARFEESADPIIVHAPILYARADTVGGFTDVPLLAYCEKLDENGRPLLEYTIVFSNEDGGTSSRALMARWGRTTDIEYIYRAWLGPNGSVLRATIQTKDHQEVEFRGQRIDAHPVLMPVTQNNMVSGDAESQIRYQLAPFTTDLRSASREQVMDSHPETYRVMAQELLREHKLRPYGATDGQKISDPRNYLYLEARIANDQSATGVHVKLRNENTWLASHLGRADYALERSGWVRTAIELPPGTKPSDIEGIGFECLVKEGKPPPSVAGACRVERVSKTFFLDADYRPQPSFFQTSAPIEIVSGRIAVLPLSF